MSSPSGRGEAISGSSAPKVSSASTIGSHDSHSSRDGSFRHVPASTKKNNFHSSFANISHPPYMKKATVPVSEETVVFLSGWDVQPRFQPVLNLTGLFGMPWSWNLHDSLTKRHWSRMSFLVSAIHALSTSTGLGFIGPMPSPSCPVSIWRTKSS